MSVHLTDIREPRFVNPTLVEWESRIASNTVTAGGFPPISHWWDMKELGTEVQGAGTGMQEAGGGRGGGRLQGAGTGVQGAETGDAGSRNRGCREQERVQEEGCGVAGARIMVVQEAAVVVQQAGHGGL